MQMATCSSCGKRIEIGWWPFCADGHEPTSSRDAVGMIPPVIFRNKKGEILFPGRGDKKPPAGYERVELRTMAEIRRFEKEFGNEEKRKHQDKQQLEEIREVYYSRRRISNLRTTLQNLPPNLRPYAERAIQRADSRSISVAARKYDPKVCFEAFSYDASNRERCDDRRDMLERCRR
jgi:hypothetical protein